MRKFLMSPSFVDYTISCGYGTKCPGWELKDGKNAFFLFLHTEQNVIVSKVEAITLKCVKKQTTIRFSPQCACSSSGGDGSDIL